MAIIMRQGAGKRAAAATGYDGAAPTGQRIRIGLTMLAAIFLVVLVAAAGMRPHRSVAPADSAGEPLANMGLAPGAGHADAAAATATQAAPPPRPVRAVTAAPPPAGPVPARP